MTLSLREQTLTNITQGVRNHWMLGEPGAFTEEASEVTRRDWLGNETIIVTCYCEVIHNYSRFSRFKAILAWFP